MCHNDKLTALPEPGHYQHKEQAGGLTYWEYQAQSSTTAKLVIVLTDIYGCNRFYQSFATYLASKGWRVQLIDLFTELGELKEVTREAAFERRHLLRDGQVCDQIERHIASEKVDAVVGFCLGANYVLEMARRNVSVNLAGYYPFPAGLANQNELEKPLDYMAQLTTPVTLFVGGSDDSAGRENMAQTAKISGNTEALEVHIYEESGHGFLSHLDSDDDTLRNNAEDSLGLCEQAINK